LLLLLSANAWTQCITPTATIAVQPGSNPCNGQSFNLILSSTVTGIAPFDLTINSPAGTATYNDVSPGAVITSLPSIKNGGCQYDCNQQDTAVTRVNSELCFRICEGSSF
jgi:hypothetical protein